MSFTDLDDSVALIRSKMLKSKGDQEKMQAEWLTTETTCKEILATFKAKVNEHVVSMTSEHKEMDELLEKITESLSLEKRRLSIDSGGSIENEDGENFAHMFFEAPWLTIEELENAGLHWKNVHPYFVGKHNVGKFAKTPRKDYWDVIPYLCLFCKNKYTSKACTFEHILKLHLENQERCQICNLQTFSLDEKFKHQRKFHPKEIRERICSEELEDDEMDAANRDEAESRTLRSASAKKPPKKSKKI